MFLVENKKIMQTTANPSITKLKWCARGGGHIQITRTCYLDDDISNVPDVGLISISLTASLQSPMRFIEKNKLQQTKYLTPKNKMLLKNNIVFRSVTHLNIRSKKDVLLFI